jgi:hypothetical protein
VVGSIAATDFSSVAGLGTLLPPGAAARCLPCMLPAAATAACSALWCPLLSLPRPPLTLPLFLSACLQILWCGSCVRWYCCRCSTQSSLKAWACSRPGEHVARPLAPPQFLLAL